MKSSDKLAIHELLSRAAYSIDQRKPEVFRQCFTDDASMLINISGSGEVGPFEGRESIMQLVSDTWAAHTDVRRHVISNIFFEAEGKKAATVVSSLVVTAVENGEINVIISGIYRDEIIKKEGGWQILNRHLDLDIPF